MSDKLEIPLGLNSSIEKDLKPITSAFINLGKVASIRVEQIHSSLKKLNTPLATSTTNLNKMATALKGINARELSNANKSFDAFNTRASKAAKSVALVKKGISGITAGSQVGALSLSLDRIRKRSGELKENILLLNKAIKTLGRGHNLTALGNTLGKLDKKVKKITGSVKTFQDASKESATSLQKLSETDLGNVASTIQTLGKGLGTATKGANKLKTGLSRVTVSGGKATTSLRRMNKVLRANKDAAKGFDKQVQHANTSIKKLSSNERLNKIERQFKKGSNEALGFKESVDQIGFSLFKTQQSLTIIASLTGVTFAIAKARDFGKAMSEVSTLIDHSTSSLEQYNSMVFDLADQFSQDPAEGAKALYQAISLGATSASKAQSLLTASFEAAQAGASSVETTTTLLASTINAFGLSMADASDLSDSFFATVKGGGTTLEQLANNFADVSAMAASVSIKVPELNAVIADMTNAGVQTPKVMTQIRATIEALLNPTAELNAIFKEVGGAQASFKNNGLVESMRLVADAAAGDIGKLKQLVGTTEAVNAISVVMRNNMVGVNKTLDDQANRFGAAAEAAQNYNDTPSSKLEKAFNSIGNTMTKLGTALTEIVQPAVTAISIALEAFVQILTGVPLLLETLVTALGVVAAFLIGTFIKEVLRAASSVKTLALSITEANAAGSLGGFKKFTTSASSAGGVMAAFGGGIAKLLPLIGKVTIVVSALVLAYEGLKLLDEYFGVSDKIAGYFEKQKKMAALANDELVRFTDNTTKFGKTYKSVMGENTKMQKDFTEVLKSKDNEKFLEFMRKYKTEIISFHKEERAAQEALVASQRASEQELNKLIDLVGIGAVAYQEFTKELETVANQEISRTFNNNTKAIRAFVTELDSGLRKAQGSASLFTTKTVASFAASAAEVVSASGVAYKRLRNLANTASKDSSKARSEGLSSLASIIGTYNKAAERFNSKFQEATTKYKALLKERKSIVKDSEDLQKSLDSTFSPKLSGAAEARKTRGEELAAVRNIGSVERELLDIRKQIAATDDPRAKQDLIDKGKEVLKTTNETWKVLKDKDPTFTNRFSSSARNMHRILTDSNKFFANTSKGINTQNTEAALSEIETAKQALASLRASADEVINFKVKLAANNTKESITKILDEAASLIKDYKPLVANIVFQNADATKGLSSEVTSFAKGVTEAAKKDVPINLTFGDQEGNKKLLADTITGFINIATEKPVIVKLDIDTIDFNKEIEKQVDALNNLAIKAGTIRLGSKSGAARGGAVNRANGGLISGEGSSTSDSIPAMLSNGEFVVRASAVQKYGSSLFNNLNGLTAPLPAVSMVEPLPVQRFATGGLVRPAQAPSNDTVNLNLNLGGRTFAVQGAREQVTGLVDALNTISQGAL